MPNLIGWIHTNTPDVRKSNQLVFRYSWCCVTMTRCGRRGSILERNARTGKFKTATRPPQTQKGGYRKCTLTAKTLDWEITMVLNGITRTGPPFLTRAPTFRMIWELNHKYTDTKLKFIMYSEPNALVESDDNLLSFIETMIDSCCMVATQCNNVMKMNHCRLSMTTNSAKQHMLGIPLQDRTTNRKPSDPKL